jgi:hypothetical protein
VRAQVTRQFYRICLDLDLDESLAAPESVQAFIDEELAEGVFDPRYQGIYDNRCLELASFDQLIRDVDVSTKAPSSADQLLSSVRGLYSTELQSWVTRHRRRRDEIEVLSEWHCPP